MHIRLNFKRSRAFYRGKSLGQAQNANNADKLHICYKVDNLQYYLMC
jgi:hypothetical protein